MQGWTIQKILFYVGLVLFLPGLAALGYTLYEGPAAWATDGNTFWGTPIALFVFWIGLAHAGTLISAIFLALGVRMDRRTAVIAELSTLCSLVIAALFPLMHLGVMENFYMVAPFADARGNFANLRSPLVWDFCCIAVYGTLSLVFFFTHLKSNVVPALAKLRRPLAWLLFPLVLWVHTIVSLDFATTFVPQWQGAFFPMYFIAGAIYSGLALVNALLWAEGYRVRLLERLMLCCSWTLIVIWFWDFLQKGEICLPAVILAGVIPQLLWVEAIRDNRTLRALVNFCILFGLFAERLYLVIPSMNTRDGILHWADYGLMLFSVGLFILMFFRLRKKLDSYIAVDSAYFGEVDGSELAQNETPEIEEDNSYKVPWTTVEFKMLWMPLLVGILSAVLFCVWSFDQEVFISAGAGFVNVIPVLYPIVALVTTFLLCLKFVRENRVFPNFGVRGKVLLTLMIMIVALLGGMLYGGGSSTAASVSADKPLSVSADSHNPVLLWNSRCATCHGADGNFNQKFVREYYPVPQKLDLARIDSLGLDSLTAVIMNGRNNMNAFGNRMTQADAHALAAYMKQLAEQKSAEQKSAEQKSAEQKAAVEPSDKEAP